MKYLIAFFISIISLSAYAQDVDSTRKEPIVIQFSGIVVSGDSSFGMPNVHIYSPRWRRGAATNEVGYFTMPALAGDSIIIKHIGYKKQYVILPDGIEKQSYTYIIDLKEDTTQLAEITVMPYPTYQLFKKAFISMDTPEQKDMENWEKNMKKEDLERMMLAMGPSSYESYRTYSLQEITRIENDNMVTMNPLLNLFAWAALVQEIRQQVKDRKEQKEKDAYESDF